MWFISQFFKIDGNIAPVIGFIPTTGLGQYGTGNHIQLQNSDNLVYLADITASSSGNLFFNSIIYNFGPNLLFSKAPGALVESLVTGPYTISDMVISLDQGITWSNKISIASTNINNRGFTSAVLNSYNNSLVIGWYDSRNDLNGISTEYYGAYISPSMLDSLVLTSF